MSTWHTIQSSIAAIAPTLGTALGGPFGAASGQRVSQLLTGEDNASPKAIQQALQAATPETLVKLKELDPTYRIQMEKLGITREKLEQMDKASARKREVDLSRAGHRDLTPPLLAFTDRWVLWRVNGDLFYSHRLWHASHFRRFDRSPRQCLGGFLLLWQFF